MYVEQGWTGSYCPPSLCYALSRSWQYYSEVNTQHPPQQRSPCSAEKVQWKLGNAEDAGSDVTNHRAGEEGRDGVSLRRALFRQDGQEKTHGQERPIFN